MFNGDAYSVRAVEYLTCVGFLVCFTMFWRFVSGGPLKSTAKAVAHEFGFFQVPDALHFHPGHAWARGGAGHTLTIGVDDFAQQLVGPLASVVLPKVGEHVTTGRVAWALETDGALVEMLAPVTGTVVAVNDAAISQPGLVNADPYGEGWLMKVNADTPATALGSLMSGDAARRWIDTVSHTLMGSMTPELGALCQDGGHPVHGFARAINEAGWEDVARRFLLS